MTRHESLLTAVRWTVKGYRTESAEGNGTWVNPGEPWLPKVLTVPPHKPCLIPRHWVVTTHTGGGNCQGSSLETESPRLLWGPDPVLMLY